jgi:hypothetical protein
LVNPSTGQRISSIQEAKQYANSLGGTQQKTSTVQKGAVVDGYKFLGGDPANQKNWKKI